MLPITSFTSVWWLFKFIYCFCQFFFFFKGKSLKIKMMCSQIGHEIGMLEAPGLGTVRLTWRYLSGKQNWIGKRTTSPGMVTCCLSISSGSVSQYFGTWGMGPWRRRMLSVSPGGGRRAGLQCPAAFYPRIASNRALPSPFPPRSCFQPLPNHINQPLAHEQISISQLSSTNRGNISRNVSRETEFLLLLNNSLTFHHHLLRQGLKKTFSQSQIYDQWWLLR